MRELSVSVFVIFHCIRILTNENLRLECCRFEVFRESNLKLVKSHSSQVQVKSQVLI